MKNVIKNMSRCDMLFILFLMIVIGYFGFMKDSDCGCGDK